MQRSAPQERGMILIAVVALLTLLAITATAFLASGRNERVATRQLSVNTQADLLLDGVVNLARANVAASATQPATAGGSDRWLSSRVPTTLDPNNIYGGQTSASPNPAAWPTIGAPLIAGENFESPTGHRYSTRDHPIPSSTNQNGVAAPALHLNIAAAGNPPQYADVIAADADGDGVADAGLFRLAGPIDGVTYFGAARIIDNSAAVNLNTAVSRDFDFSGNGSPLLTASSPTAGAFTANIGLAELMRGNAFGALNDYRWNLSASQPQPAGIAGGSEAAIFDDSPAASGPVGPRIDASTGSLEWQFPTVGAFVQTQIAQRLDHPGPVSGDGATLARPLAPNGLTLGTRFCVPWRDDASSNPLLAATAACIDTGPSSAAIATNPFPPGNHGEGIDAWFTAHFDTLREDPANATTWMCRRTLLTDFNGVSGLSPAPAPLFVPAGANGDVGRKKISITNGAFDELFYGYFKSMAGSGFTGQGDDAGTPFTSLLSEAVAKRSAVPVNRSAGLLAATGAYYSDPYVGARFDSPTPAAPLASADRREPAGLASVVNGRPNVAEQHPLRMFRSPLRPPVPMSTASGNAPAWDRYTPRLPADQVLILRAALTAANLEALRDSSHNPQFAGPSDLSLGRNERAPSHRIPLVAMIDGQPTPVVANVFGLRRQPFIAEVYANTLAGFDGAAAPAPPALVRPNPKGYVAIKIYNPTAVPISLQHCRLVGLHRTRNTPYTTSEAAYPNMTVRPLAALTAGNADTTDQIDLGSTAITSNVLGAIYPPTVIPANGTLVLENIPGSGPAFPDTAAEDADYRPTSTGLLSANGDNTGLISPVDFERQNYAYVPGLTRVVWDRDLVLMRPTNCRPPSMTDSPVNTLVYQPANPDAATTSIAGLMPLDAFDFTGLAPLNDSNYTPVRQRAEIWHYVRAVTPGGWQWVYPGRYDGDQTLTAAPRQQGTVRAVSSDGGFGWNPQVTKEKDPFAEQPAAGNVVSLAMPIAAGTAATYPDVFTIRLNDKDWPSANPLHDYTLPAATPNLFPFGGFTRLADMLQAPFIGAYTLQTEANAEAGNDVYLDITPVTMDAAFAEDTDPADNEQPGDDGSQSREQIGRFIPLRPSVARTGGTPAQDMFKANADPALPPTVGPQNDPAFDQTDSGNLDPLRCGDNADDVHLNRYAFARGLFDQFLMIAPDRNYSPNYPTQPAWSPGTAYTAGDTAQYGQDIFVCRTAASSSTDPASSPNWLRLPRYLVARTDHDLDPLIPGQINLNTAPEAVLAALPWSPRRTADVSSDSLTFDFNAYLPAVTARGDGIDDNAQIAHAIVLYRDGRYGHTDGASANKLGTTASSQTWCAAAAPFRSLFDLYNVPGIRAAQNALLQAGGTKDFAGQTLLLDRASNLITTRSDAFTLYALVQGWKDAGTPQARLVVQRRVSLTMRRKLGGDGSSKSTVVSRIP